MKPIKIDEWIPTDNLKLEYNALYVAKNTESSLVVAGPGAGKTELLAQKACFLLQTNTCEFPHKILAISFKRDAAYNLKERVKLRCGDELSRRFDSLTFDSFAKQIVDRFRRALPKEYRISSEYDVVLNDASILEYYETENRDYFNSTHRNTILNLHTAVELPFPETSKEEIIRANVWKRMLAIQPSKLTFKMIMRMAELIINSNPKIKHYLQQTYHYVFLDEFQDATWIQYNFFKCCFLGSKSTFTAVGDDKQRIMLWAGAQETVFEDFIADTGADRVPLTLNFRCAPRLVSLLNHLTEHLLGKTDLATPSPRWRLDQGECSVWVFENPTSEIQILFNTVKEWINNEGLNPRDICILVKQQLDRYAGTLINYFNENGIKARDENKYQDLLTQEVSLYIIHTLYIIFDKRTGDSKSIAFVFLSNLHTELEDEQLLKLEVSFSIFIKKMKTDYGKETITESQIKRMIDDVVNYANKDWIRSVYLNYKNVSVLDGYINTLKDEFIKNYNMTKNALKSLDMLIGKDTIPVMTIHKSKGLEYHTIIFIGLEDGAFWSFQQQPDEDKCAFFVALSRAKERVIFTFSKQREGRFGIQTQAIRNIKVLFEELQKSGIVNMIEKSIKTI